MVDVEHFMRAAIRQRRAVAVRYKRPGRRTVHPHALFLTSEGKKRVNGFQVDGPTEPGRPLPYWRQFDLDDVEEVKRLDDVFEIRPDFNPEGAMYRHGLVEYVKD